MEISTEYLRSITRVIGLSPQARLAAGPTQSVPTQVQFDQSGWIVGFVADSRNSNAPVQRNRSQLEVKLEVVGGQSAITSDGKSSSFCPVNVLCGDLANPLVWPLVRRVKPNDKIAVTFFNADTVNAVTPTASFLFLRAQDLPPDYCPEPVNTRLPGCTRALVNVHTFATALPGSSQSPDNILELQWDGWITAFRAALLNDDGSGRTSISVKLSALGSEMALTAQRSSSEYVALTHLCGGPEVFAPFVRRFAIHDQFRLNFFNETAATSLQPVGALFLRCDADVAAPSLNG